MTKKKKNRCTWRWNDGNTRLCLQCNRGVKETVEHLVLECSKYEQKRESLMDVVHEQCGERRWNARCVEEDSGQGIEPIVSVDDAVLSSCHSLVENVPLSQPVHIGREASDSSS
ncbi:hypothetical protein FHG87_023197 [Trinorchestia longiramus]|nr:hypothetical protein FHG87_023197 [Trinorchestia longiramus]